MAKRGFGVYNSKEMDYILGTSTKKKRKTLTPAQRIFIWEHPKLYGRKCSICHEKITKMSDLELDHTKSFKSGGKKQALAHKHCNRMKGSGSLGKIQRELGIKSKTKKRKTTKKRIKRDTSLGMFKVKFL